MTVPRGRTPARAAVLGASIERQRRLEVQINALAQRKFTAREFTEFLDGVLGASPKSDDHPDGEPTAARMRIAANFDHELQRLRGIEHSAWAAFNAVSQYVDWERPTRGGGGGGSESLFGVFVAVIILIVLVSACT